MAIKDIFKISRKTFFNPSGWLDVENLGLIFKTTWLITRRLFIPAEPTHQETFEEAVKRLNITEEDIEQKKKVYVFATCLFLIFGITAFLLSFYWLFVFHTFSGFLIGLATSSLFLVQAFRYNFWYFQTQHRKLGCTVDEWWEGKLNSEKGPKS